MSDINNLRFQLGAEIEALVAEINELKKRVTELEHDRFHKAVSESKEYIGEWIDKKITERSMITCNTSEIA